MIIDWEKYRFPQTLRPSLHPRRTRRRAGGNDNGGGVITVLAGFTTAVFIGFQIFYPVIDGPVFIKLTSILKYYEEYFGVLTWVIVPIAISMFTYLGIMSTVIYLNVYILSNLQSNLLTKRRKDVEKVEDVIVRLSKGFYVVAGCSFGRVNLNFKKNVCVFVAFFLSKLFIMFLSWFIIFGLIEAGGAILHFLIGWSLIIVFLCQYLIKGWRNREDTWEEIVVLTWKIFGTYLPAIFHLLFPMILGLATWIGLSYCLIICLCLPIDGFPAIALDLVFPAMAGYVVWRFVDRVLSMAMDR